MPEGWNNFEQLDRAICEIQAALGAMQAQLAAFYRRPDEAAEILQAIAALRADIDTFKSAANAEAASLIATIDSDQAATIALLTKMIDILTAAPLQIVAGPLTFTTQKPPTAAGP